MKFTTHTTSRLLVASSLCAGAYASFPDLNNFPDCAFNCAIQYLGEHHDGCNIAQFACHCRDQNLIAALPAIFHRCCPPPQRKQAWAWAVTECSKVGVPIPSSSQSASAAITTVSATPRRTSPVTSFRSTTALSHSPPHSSVGNSTAAKTSSRPAPTRTTSAQNGAKPTMSIGSPGPGITTTSTPASSSFYESTSSSVSSNRGQQPANGMSGRRPYPNAGSWATAASPRAHQAGVLLLSLIIVTLLIL